MMSTTIDFLSWTRSDDDTSDEGEEEDLLVIEEEFSEYESFHILDDTDDNWSPSLVGRQSLIKSFFSTTSQEHIPASWTNLRTKVRSKLDTFQKTWDQRMKQSHVLDTVISLSQSSASFWDPTECPTPTSSNRTPSNRWSCGFGGKSHRDKNYSSTSPVPILQEIELVHREADRSNSSKRSWERVEEEVNASLLEGEEEYTFVSESNSDSSEDSIFFFLDPIPLRRV